MVEVNCDFMVKAKIPTAGDDNLWKWPSKSCTDNQTIHKNSVIPIKPCLEVSKFSSHRLIIFQLTNAELIEKFM